MTKQPAVSQMITVDHIVSWLSDPSGLEPVSAEELLSLRDAYPFCEPLHWLLLRKMHVCGDIRFGQELVRSSVHISDRRALYNFLHYEAATVEADAALDSMTAAVQDYFAVEGNEHQRKTLQELAARLKAARMARRAAEDATRAEADSEDIPQEPDSNAFIHEVRPEGERVGLSDPESQKPPQDDVPAADGSTLPDNAEDEAKRLVREKKYAEALRILKAINLNNPKKSAYFALQIKYIETILANNK